MKTLLAVFLLLCFSHIKNASSQALLDKSQWHLLYRDDFNYSNIDEMLATNNGDTWSEFSPLNPNYPCGITVLDGDGGDPITYFSKDFLSVANGLLRIDAHSDPANPEYYACNDSYYPTQSGQVWYKFNEPCIPQNPLSTGFLYGMFEIRCKLPCNPEPVPSFWMTDGGFWEMDVFEGGCRINNDQSCYDSGTGDSSLNCFSSTDHWCEYAGGCTWEHCQTIYSKPTPRRICEDFHTWTLLWTPYEISWFFDGKEIRTDSQTNRIGYSCDAKEHILIGSGGGKNWCYYDSEQENDPFLVDYVAFYKPCDNYLNNPCNASSDYSIPWKQYSEQSLDNSTHLLTMSGQLNSNIAQSKISVDNSSNTIYFKKTNGQMYASSYNSGTGTWPTVAQPASDVSSDITFTPFESRVYYRSTFNKLKYSHYGYTVEVQYSGGCAGFLSSDNNGNIFFVDLSNKICKFDVNSGNVSVVFNNTPGTPILGLAAYSAGTRVNFIKNDHSLWQTKKLHSGWSSPNQLLSTNVNGDILIEVPSDNNSRIYYRGDDGYIYNYYYNGSSWNNFALTNWSGGDNNAFGGLALSTDNQLIFYNGSDGRIWYYFTDKGWSSGNGLWYNSALDWSKTNGSPFIAVRDNGNFYYVGSNARLYECNWILGEHTVPDAYCYPTLDAWSNVFKIESGSTNNTLLHVFANPSFESIKIKIDSLTTPTIQIFNILGQLVHASLLPSNYVDLNISDWSSGLYTLVLLGDGYFERARFIKQ